MSIKIPPDAEKVNLYHKNCIVQGYLINIHDFEGRKAYDVYTGRHNAPIEMFVATDWDIEYL